MVQLITESHKLYPYLVLYRKDTDKPILDPCFGEYTIRFSCGHEKVLFRDKYTMADQHCAVCNAMREVDKFEFTGAKTEDLDYERDIDLQPTFKEWDCEKKTGKYYLCRPKKMANGKYIAHKDYSTSGSYDKFMEGGVDAAEYTDPKAKTVFEVPDYSLYMVDVVKALKEYLTIPDVEAYEVVKIGRKNDGNWIWERKRKLDKDIAIPQPPHVEV